MRTLLFYFVTLYIFSVTLSIASENNDKKTTEEPSTKTTKIEKPVNQNISKRSQVKTLEEFIPSEEVSADKPVAFPNDI